VIKTLTLCRILIACFLSYIEDELQNVEMAEEERLKERKELKIKKRDYTGYDDDEFVEGNQGLMKRSILAKYDEDIEGRRSSVSH
jgi:U4/U6.U5 tri-snRNP-associated protein 1